jgi:hypothetical protein
MRAHLGKAGTAGDQSKMSRVGPSCSTAAMEHAWSTPFAQQVHSVEISCDQSPRCTMTIPGRAVRFATEVAEHEVVNLQCSRRHKCAMLAINTAFLFKDAGR